MPRRSYGISDHAIRSLVPVWFVRGVDDFTEQVFRAVWPGTKPLLEDAIRNLATRLESFIKHYMTKAGFRTETMYGEDIWWKREVHDFEERDRLSQESKEWDGQSAKLLLNVVVALNEYADAVRTHLNPNYFRLLGRFTLHDSLGVTNDMRDIHYMPTAYDDPDA